MVRTQLCTQGEHSWPGSGTPAWGPLCSGSPRVGLSAATCRAGRVSWVAGKCYPARFGLCVTLDLSVLLVERGTETILQNKPLECYV